MTQPYSIQTNQAAKKVEMKVGGTFTPQDYQNFVRDYGKMASSIDAPAFTLEVDCREMDLLASEEVDKLKGSFASYKETGFQKVIFVINTKQTIIKMQLGRVARDAGLSNHEIVTK
ncbi:hypothetical protein [Saccharibacillus kuerlensis]|uniref:STAS domain-containing protein n=1 Tax=Saccharibacillus kuerlensis TaxID=459527 RepID=A0ABQ2L5B0_9BACL|nr:hypothetical protein [Saccharibacillus kuerlensis]GGO03952.1 hypothetical protein GCM10010969_28690 [Saccharibacillus kuerlensis]